MDAEEHDESREGRLLAVYHLWKNGSRNQNIRYNIRRRYISTALSKIDAVIHHFSHEGLFATRRNSSQRRRRFKSNGNRTFQDFCLKVIRMSERTVLGKSSFVAAVRVASSMLA